MSSGETTRIIDWVDRMRRGDGKAIDELLVHFEGRLLSLTRRMLKEFPTVRRWEETDDVFLEAAMRLRRALLEVSPRSTREFFGLAALQIRRELLNMAQSYRNRLSPSQFARIGPEGGTSDDGGGDELVDHRLESTAELDDWAAFHEAAAALPGEIREVFHLIWFDGLTQVEAASVLGISERNVRGRWQEAREAIHRALDGRLPGT